jgi:hypothetical protein
MRERAPTGLADGMGTLGLRFLNDIVHVHLATGLARRRAYLMKPFS